jgi:hypothetical protein
MTFHRHAPVAVFAATVACAPGGASDAAPVGDYGLHGCMWLARPPNPGPCAAPFEYIPCADWAQAVQTGSDLVVYSTCDVSAGCVSADACDRNGTNCTCGGAPACADGYACGHTSGSRTPPSCVQCRR